MGGAGGRAVIFGVLLVSAGIIWARSAKPAYEVILTTCGGQHDSLSSRDQLLIEKITFAISEAITFRG